MTYRNIQKPICARQARPGMRTRTRQEKLAVFFTGIYFDLAYLDGEMGKKSKKKNKSKANKKASKNTEEVKPKAAAGTIASTASGDLLLCEAQESPSREAKPALRVAFVGNSFFYFNDVPRLLETAADPQGDVMLCYVI